MGATSTKPKIQFFQTPLDGPKPVSSIRIESSCAAVTMAFVGKNLSVLYKIGTFKFAPGVMFFFQVFVILEV